MSTADLLQARAMFAPETVNVDARTVDVVWSTGAPVKRSDWMSGDYIEELSLEPQHVRLGRLNNGAPFLASHDNWSLRSVLGVVERAWLGGNEGRATVRFSKREEVEPFFQDVRDGILRNVSVGYRKHKTERDETGPTPIVRAIDWEPYEISLVSIPADAGAQVRSEEMPTMNTKTEPPKDSPMDQTRKQEPPAEAPGAEAPTTTETRTAAPAPAPASAALDAEQARSGERSRVTGILEACRKAGLDVAFSEKLITDGTSIALARAAIIDAMAERQASQPQTLHGRVEVGTDHAEKRMAVMEAGLMARAGYGDWSKDGASECRGLSLIDYARDCLELRGVGHRGLTVDEVVTRALHGISDFPLLLGSIQRVSLKAGYAQERQTWQVMARKSNLPDFRANSLIEVGGQLLPEPLQENGEYKSGTIKEAGGSWRIDEFAKKVSFARKFIINDNLGYVTEALRIMGAGVAVFEANRMWGMLTSGGVNGLGDPCMMDGKALFHADHKNTVTGAIGETSISDARQKMYEQMSFDGTTTLYVEPRYILLPPGLLTTFQKFNATVLAAKTGDVNPFAGLLEPVVEPRLTARSTKQFYIVGEYPGVDRMVYGYLEGEDGPTIDSEATRSPDGITVYLRHTFGSTIVQHQGFVRSSGE